MLKDLFDQLNINIQAFNKYAYYPIDFIAVHQQKLRFRFHDCLKRFKYSLWKYLQNNKAEQSEFLNLINEYEENEDYIEDSTSECSESFDVDYDDLVNKFIETNFPNMIMTEIFNDEEFSLIKKQNIESLGNSELVNNLPSEIESLLFFENNLEKIIEFLESQDEGEDNDDIKPTPPSSLNLIEASMSKPAESPDNTKTPRKSLYKYNPTDDRTKRKRGMASEKKVYDKLVEDYGADSVEWVSSSSSENAISDDSKHYDMRYSPNGVVWKYVEVKTLSNDHFYLTKSEKLFGEENKDSYEIFLVQDNDIYVIKDFFAFDGCSDFYDNPKYNVEDTEYIIKFRLSEKEIGSDN